VKGKLVLVRFPFTDLTGAKLRPALVLIDAEKDCVVAFISSKTPDKPSPIEIVIAENHEEFPRTGLKRTSVLRLDKVATVSKDLILGEIGEMGESLRREVNRKMLEAYRL
jgi:mRNA interferase MazF